MALSQARFTLEPHFPCANRKRHALHQCVDGGDDDQRSTVDETMPPIPGHGNALHGLRAIMETWQTPHG